MHLYNEIDEIYEKYFAKMEKETNAKKLECWLMIMNDLNRLLDKIEIADIIHPD